MSELSRRDIAKVLALAAASTASPGTVFGRASVRPRTFPTGFKWGCATAAYQIEGAVNEDGRGESIWDVFSHTPGKIKDGTNGDVACDSYHRFADDTRLLKGVGATAYRLSFAWPRIFPEGRGAANQRGVDHYKRVIDDLLENGIEPYVTLYHWDLPTKLSGGWQSRDTAKAFADYAGYVAGEFSDRVGHFITLNEVRSFIDLGYGIGLHAPGLRLPMAEINQARHHALLGHGLAVQAIRASARHKVQVGLAENALIPIPVTESEANIEAARKALRGMNPAHLVPILEGAYPQQFLEAQGANAPRIAPGDMKIISSPLDFVGMNVYTGQYVLAAANAAGYEVAAGSASYPTMGLPWLRVAPEATYWASRLASELWKPRAIYISENGSAAADKVTAGQIRDADRIMYLRNYIGHLQRATAEGYPVKGYFLWSLLDNFEWTDGFSARFGIHYTDYENKQRIPKLSAQWYKELIAANGLV